MYSEESELTKEEQEWLHLLDEELALPPLPPDFGSNVLASLGIAGILLWGRSPDYLKAVRSILRAAEQGDSTDQVLLGWTQSDDEDTESDRRAKTD